MYIYNKWRIIKNQVFFVKVCKQMLLLRFSLKHLIHAKPLRFTKICTA